jgi:hypothetical protein
MARHGLAAEEAFNHCSSVTFTHLRPITPGL